MPKIMPGMWLEKLAFGATRENIEFSTSYGKTVSILEFDKCSEHSLSCTQNDRMKQFKTDLQTDAKIHKHLFYSTFCT